MPAKHPVNKSNPSPNDWDLESSYDTVVTIEELVNRPPFKEASGKDGGSYTAAARIPSWLERKVVFLLEIKGSPYMLKGDVIRDAIYIGLRVLNMRYKNNPDWSVETKLTNVIDKVNALARIRTQVEAFVHPTIDLWDGGNEAQAIVGMEDFIGATVEVEDEWQREKMLQLLRNNHKIMPIIEKCNEDVRAAIFKEKVKVEKV